MRIIRGIGHLRPSSRGLSGVYCIYISDDVYKVLFFVSFEIGCKYTAQALWLVFVGSSTLPNVILLTTEHRQGRPPTEAWRAALVEAQPPLLRLTLGKHTLVLRVATGLLHAASLLRPAFTIHHMIHITQSFIFT